MTMIVTPRPSYCIWWAEVLQSTTLRSCCGFNDSNALKHVDSFSVSRRAHRWVCDIATHPCPGGQGARNSTRIHDNGHWSGHGCRIACNTKNILFEMTVLLNRLLCNNRKCVTTPHHSATGGMQYASSIKVAKRLCHAIHDVPDILYHSIVCASIHSGTHCT